VDGQRVSDPTALGAGLFQIGAVAANVIILWRYLMAKGEGSVAVDGDK